MRTPRRAQRSDLQCLLSLLLWISLAEWVVGLSSSDSQSVLQQDGDGSKKIAIIGAGSGGSSAAYYVARYAREAQLAVSITVYEKSGYVGGRTRTVDAYNDSSSSINEPVELGASIFVQANRNLVSAAHELGLVPTSLDDVPRSAAAAAADPLGVWNGAEWVFRMQASDSTWWSRAKLLWRYGLAPVRAQRAMRATVDRFLTLYEAPRFPWRSLSHAALDADLTRLTASTGAQALRAHGVADRFARDIVQASTRVNYGQNLDGIHGLETMVCLATDGAMQIVGGNWRIFRGMLERARARVRLETAVTGVVRRADGRFVVRSRSGSEKDDDDEDEAIFDDVVLAAPYQFAHLDISPPLPHPPDPIPYVALHVTLFTSPHRLSAAFFDRSAAASASRDPPPDVILTTLPPGPAGGVRDDDDNDGAVGPAGFFSISLLRMVRRPAASAGAAAGPAEYLYKIFSPHPVNDTFLAALLGLPRLDNADDDADANKHVTWRYDHRWAYAYPYLYPRVTFEDLLLGGGDEEERKADEQQGREQAPRGIWYTSAIESFISTMETSSLAGMNVARLVVDDWLRAGSVAADDAGLRASSRREKEKEKEREKESSEREL